MMPSRQSGSDPLPYVQVDRAVKPKAALLAGLIHSTNQHALGSLIEWWELCGDPRELERIAAATPDGEDPAVVLSAADVTRRFRTASGHEVQAEDLATLGLLEALEEDRFRVRGMSRYFRPVQARLRAKNASSAGGRASAESRKRLFGTAQPRSGAASGAASGALREHFEVDRTDSRSGTEPTPEAAPEAHRTLAYSVQRSSTSKRPAGSEAPAGFELKSVQAPKAARAPKETKPAPDPRHHPTLEAMVAIFADVRGAAPAVNGHWAKSVSDLLALAEPYEVCARWRKALSGKYPSVASPAELARHWNHWAGEAPGGATDPNQGIMRHEPASSTGDPGPSAEDEFAREFA